MSRFELIGTGSVGRVYRPGFSCTNQKETAPGYISKVMSRAHADEELVIYRHLRLDEVPNAHKYAIFDPIDCPGVKAGKGCKGILNYRDGGETLSVILSGRPSPAELRRLLTSFKTIIAGLTELNRMNRFHMDVKPDNITVDGHGTMRLIDFGWSRYFPNGVAAKAAVRHSLNRFTIPGSGQYHSCSP
jgi:serine/threonine protein kinase